MRRLFITLAGLVFLVGFLGWILQVSNVEPDLIFDGGGRVESVLDEAPGARRKPVEPVAAEAKEDFAPSAIIEPPSLDLDAEPVFFCAQVLSDGGRPQDNIGAQLFLKNDLSEEPLGNHVISDSDGRLMLSLHRRDLERGSAKFSPFWRIDGIFKDVLWVKVDPASSPDAPQAIVLPLFGWVSFEFRGPGGRLEGESIDLHISLNADPPSSLAIRGKYYRTPRSDFIYLRGISKTGRLTLGPVAVGLRIRGEAIAGRGEANTGSKGRLADKGLSFDGPSFGGQTLERVLEWTRFAPRFVARILDVSQRPWANGEFKFQFERRIGKRVIRELGQTRSDAEGSLYILRTTESVFRDGQRDFLRIEELLPRRAQEPPRQANVELTERLKTEDHELGDIELKAPGSLVAGRVVDATGKALEGVNFKVEIQKGSTTQTIGRRDKVWLFPSSAAGEFRIFGAMDNDRDSQFFVSAHKGGYARSSRKKFRPGEEGIEIVLLEGASIEFKLVDEGEIKASQFRYRVTQSRHPRQRIHVTRQFDGTHRTESLASGPYELEFFANQGQVSVLKLEDIAVQAGKNHDLGILHPGRGLKKYDLEFADEQAQALKGVFITWNKDQDHGAKAYVYASESKVSLLDSRAALTLNLWLGGFASQAVSVSPGANMITLHPGPEVRIASVVDWPQLNKVESLRYFFIPKADGLDAVGCPAGKDGSASLRFSSLGLHDLGIQYIMKDGALMSMKNFEGEGEPITIDVKADKNPVFDFVLPKGFIEFLNDRRKELGISGPGD
ncbi:MAG: hypothetical protein V3W41_19820 [Planctomycetota bacterium]